jgi:uncharacterized protein YlzI (FlbEa/FlbD family)
LDGDVLLVNPHSIRTIARLGPNSSVRFGDGRGLVVAEPPEEIAHRVAEWECEVRRVGEVRGAAAALPVGAIDAPHGSDGGDGSTVDLTAGSPNDGPAPEPAAAGARRHLRLVR